MSCTMPVGALATGPYFGADFSATARALLDSGAVLAFRLSASIQGESWAAHPAVYVAIPDPDKGVRWLSQTQDILAATAHIPTLVQACFEIAQSYTSCFYLYPLLSEWTPEDTERHDAELTILPSGYTLGQEDAGTAMDMEVEEACEALEAGECPQEFNTDRLLSVILTLPEGGGDSAHAQLQAAVLGQKLVDEWLRADTTWAQDPAFPLVGPTAQTISFAIKRHNRPY